MNFTLITQIFKYLPYAIVLGVIGYLSLQLNLERSENRQLKQQISTFTTDAEKLQAEVNFQIKLAQQISDQQAKTNSDAWQKNYIAIKNQYEKAVKNNEFLINNTKKIVRSNSDLTSRLRDEIRASQNRMSNIPKDTERDAEGWRKLYTNAIREYNILGLACADTTNHFNRCRLILDEHCSLIDCTR